MGVKMNKLFALTKQCKMCKEVKLTACFYKQVHTNSYRSYCKDCSKSSQRKWVKTYPDKQRSYVKKWKSKNKGYIANCIAKRMRLHPKRYRRYSRKTYHKRIWGSEIDNVFPLLEVMYNIKKEVNNARLDRDNKETKI
jgi:hypothetical protein